jgi:hypothetical protein
MSRQLHVPAALPPTSLELRCPLDWRLSVPQSQTGRCGENWLPQVEIRPRYLGGRPTRSVVATPSDLSQIIVYFYKNNIAL